MFVKSTITNTMITHRIEIASIAISNDLTCVCLSGNSIWRLPLPLSIMSASYSPAIPGWGGGSSPRDSLPLTEYSISRRFSYRTQAIRTTTVTTIPSQVRIM
jgi:hypothetical protein